jgi:hypothetical protein
MATSVSRVRCETLRTLPEDNVRQILWRFADRCDLQMLVQSAREVARGPVARLVAGGLRSGLSKKPLCWRRSTSQASPQYSWTRNKAVTWWDRRTWPWR